MPIRLFKSRAVYKYLHYNTLCPQALNISVSWARIYPQEGGTSVVGILFILLLGFVGPLGSDADVALAKADQSFALAPKSLFDRETTGRNISGTSGRHHDDSQESDTLLPCFVDIHGPEAKEIGAFAPWKFFPLYLIGEPGNQREMYLKRKSGSEKDWPGALMERLAYRFAHLVRFKNIQPVQLAMAEGSLWALVAPFKDAEILAGLPYGRPSKLYQSHPELHETSLVNYPAWLNVVLDPQTFVETELFRHFFSHGDSIRADNWIVRQFGDKSEVTVVDFENALRSMPIPEFSFVNLFQNHKDIVLRYGMRLMKALADLTDEQIDETLAPEFMVVRSKMSWIAEATTEERYNYNHNHRLVIQALKNQRDRFRRLYEELSTIMHSPGSEDKVRAKDISGASL